MKNKLFLTVLMSALAVTSISLNAAVTTNNAQTKSSTETKAAEQGPLTTAQKPEEQAKLADNQTMVMGKVQAATSSQVTFYEGTENSMGNNGQQMATPPEKPAGDNGTTPPEKPAGDNGATPPEKPAGDNGTSAPEKPAGDNGTTSEKPAGDNGAAPQQGGQQPQAMNMTWSSETTTLALSSDAKLTKQGEQGKSQTITYSDIAKDDQVRMIIETAADGSKSIVSLEVMDKNGAGPGQGVMGDEAASVQGTAVKLVDGAVKKLNKQTIKATDKNQSDVKVVNGGKLTLTSSRLTKTGASTATQESDFYGLNAGVLATSKSMAIISDTTINTSAEGANGVFATGENSSITLKNVMIKTTGNSSRGLDATYGGKVTGTNVNIITKGDHCAALATDRGEGTITVTGGTMNTAGEGSPCIYSTGNISATNAVMKATGSQAAVIEGKNSITLNNSTLTGAGTCGVMLYQSFSGDAGVGTSVFNMTGGKLTATNGPIFFINNTQAVANLKNATLCGTGSLIAAHADRWGTEGSNGGHFTLNAASQKLEGTIIADSISTVTVKLTDNSTLTSTVNADQKAESMTLSLDKTSTWNVMGDSYLTVLTDEDSTLANIKDNGHNVYYDSTKSENSWLNGETKTLQDGGKLMPVK